LPVYVVTATGSRLPANLGALLRRLIPLDIRKIERHARHRELRGSPPGLVITKASGHPLKLDRPGKRPVTLDTVKWKNADYPVVRQLAAFFDMTAADYVEEVLAS
jgi:hypothetical protein